jgi:hypothetical protein
VVALACFRTVAGLVVVPAVIAVPWLLPAAGARAARVRAFLGRSAAVVVRAVPAAVSGPVGALPGASGALAPSAARAGPYVIGPGAELRRELTEVSRYPEREDVPPQDHEVAVDVVPLPVVGLEDRQREEHRLAENQQQSPRGHDHDGRGQHELREAGLRRGLAEQPAVPHDAAQPVAGPEQAPDDVEDDAAAPRGAADGLVPVVVPVAVPIPI